MECRINRSVATLMKSLGTCVVDLWPAGLCTQIEKGAFHSPPPPPHTHKSLLNSLSVLINVIPQLTLQTNQCHLSCSDHLPCYTFQNHVQIDNCDQSLYNPWNRLLCCLAIHYLGDRVLPRRTTNTDRWTILFRFSGSKHILTKFSLCTFSPCVFGSHNTFI